MDFRTLAKQNAERAPFAARSNERRLYEQPAALGIRGRGQRHGTHRAPRHGRCGYGRLRVRQISLHCGTCARAVVVKPYRGYSSVTPSPTMLQHDVYCMLVSSQIRFRRELRNALGLCPVRVSPRPTAAAATAAVVLPPSISRSHIVFSRPNNDVAFENHLQPPRVPGRADRSSASSFLILFMMTPSIRSRTRVPIAFECSQLFLLPCSRFVVCDCACRSWDFRSSNMRTLNLVQKHGPTDLVRGVKVMPRMHETHWQRL